MKPLNSGNQIIENYFKISGVRQKLMDIFGKKKKEQKEPDFIDITQIAETYCDKIIECAKQIEETKKEYRQVNLFISDIQKFEMLPREQFDYLSSLAAKLMEIEQDKITYKTNLTKLSEEQFHYISSNEDNIVSTIKSIDEEEKRLSEVKSNMKHIEGEKEALKFERQELKNHLYLLQGIAKIAIISLFILIVVFLIAEFVFSFNTNSYLYTTIAIVLLFTLCFFVLNRNLLFKIKLNEQKLNRAISLLNKSKLLYVNVISGLEYVYEKNKVHHSYELANLWSQYVKLKQQKQVYKNASNMLYDVSGELYELFNTYKICDANEWFNRLDLIINSTQRNAMKNELINKREGLKKKIDENLNIIEQSKTKVKELVNKNKDYADEILQLINQYENLL